MVIVLRVMVEMRYRRRRRCRRRRRRLLLLLLLLRRLVLLLLLLLCTRRRRLTRICLQAGRTHFHFVIRGRRLAQRGRIAVFHRPPATLHATQLRRALAHVHVELHAAHTSLQFTFSCRGLQTHHCTTLTNVAPHYYFAGTDDSILDRSCTIHSAARWFFVLGEETVRELEAPPSVYAPLL